MTPHERLPGGDPTLEAAFNPRWSVPDFTRVMLARAAASAAVCAQHHFVGDVRYGPHERETLDVFPSIGARGPVLAYVHGGYWRSGRARDNCAVAAPFVHAGAAVFVINYPLCPEVTLASIVSSIERALTWIAERSHVYGGDSNRLFVAGLSAGAHLTAMLVSKECPHHRDEARSLIKGAGLVSGIFDLTPVCSISVNQEVQLTPSTAAALSPVRYAPDPSIPLQLWVGEEEPIAWRKQSIDYQRHCEQHGATTTIGVVPGANHFTIFDALSRPGGMIAEQMLMRMKGDQNRHSR